jgi:dihydropteroate synthase-like protein
LTLKILLVTGEIASESILKNVSDIEHEITVRTLPVSVAAFITPKFALKYLVEDDLDTFDLILLPGTIQGDVSLIEQEIGIPTFKGPNNLSDLPLLLELINNIQLSKTVSATDLLSETKNNKAFSEIRKVEANWEAILKQYGGLVIGSDSCKVPIGNGFPMRVIAEIVNAPTLKMEIVREKARYFEKEGADIIDLGMLAGNPNPDIIKDLVDTVKDTVNLPVSIDTLNPKEIVGAVEAGVDLVLSIDAGNMEEVAHSIIDIPVVVLPTNMKEGIIPKTAEERVKALLNNIQKASRLGINKIIADPVLEPAINPGLLESLNAYKLFREIDRKTPVLYGLGNVTELIDIDSTGVNGILTALAAEVSANLLFIPEYSTKAKKSVRDTSRASKMMYLAKKREMPPKDLGIDVLVLKEKRWNELPYDEKFENQSKVFRATSEDNLVFDNLGWYKIVLDRLKEDIVAIHFNENEDPDIVVRGKNAREIYKTLIRKGVIGNLDHAAYLGKELYKAEIALILGRSYRQDEPLF